MALKPICPMAVRKGRPCNGECPFRFMYVDRTRGTKYLSCGIAHKQIADENGETVEYEISIDDAVKTTKTEGGQKNVR